MDLSLKKAFEIIEGIEASAKNAHEIQSNGQHKSVEMNAVTSREQSKRVKIQFSPLTVHDVLRVGMRQLCVDSKMPNSTSATKRPYSKSM